MMSLILGRYCSKLACDGSLLKVSSKIFRSESGTGPRSDVSTPIVLNALQAMLNSYPSRTYTSDTLTSVASCLDHAVKISSSCFVATSRCVTLFSMVEICDWDVEVCDRCPCPAERVLEPDVARGAAS